MSRLSTGLAMVFALAWTASALLQAGEPQRIETDLLPNAYRLTEKIISGGQPHGEQAFAELRDLGVKTIISVDGAKPDLEAAKKYDLRYVHLPHGYDGISDERMAHLAKAFTELAGPIYIHCHHGKHRSPAAAAAGCVAADMLDSKSAQAFLKIAGTSPAYRGLYQTVESARPLDAAVLAADEVEFLESVPVAPLAEAMVALEHTHDRLKLIAAADWQSPADHPDLAPAHEALLLREHFTEMLRSEGMQDQSKKFLELLRQSEADSRLIETELESATIDRDKLAAALYRVTANCKSCHQQFRDVPLREKAGEH